MIALLRSTDGNPDSRFEKYLQFLDRSGVRRLTMCWDRFGVKSDEGEDVMYYKRPAVYGSGMRNMVGLLGFNRFLWRQLWRRRHDYNVVHAADLDTVLPAVLAKLLLGKKLIYDIYDWYIDSRNIRNPLMRAAVSMLEWISIRSADVTIICEEGRRGQIHPAPRHLWVLPNIPALQIDTTPANRKEGSPVELVYVGILSEERGLELLPRLARECGDKVHITVAGFGPLGQSMANVASELPNFTYRGRVAYAEALRMMGEADVIYAAYHKTNPNHLLAAPNKYYEGLALGRPVITTEGTLVGDKVTASDTGYVIGETVEDLKRVFNDWDEGAWRRKCANASELWDTQWKDYVVRFITGHYLPFISGSAASVVGTPAQTPTDAGIPHTTRQTS